MSFFDFRCTAVLVRFTSGYYGGYCDHIWEDLKEEYGHKVEFRTYNSIRHKDMLEKMKVVILPTFYLYQRGVLVREVRGTKIEELRAILDCVKTEI
jgi:hypothetical protein